MLCVSNFHNICFYLKFNPHVYARMSINDNIKLKTYIIFLSCQFLKNLWTLVGNNHLKSSVLLSGGGGKRAITLIVKTSVPTFN